MKIHTVPAGIPRMPLSKYLLRAWPMLPGWVVRDAMKQRSVRINGVKSGADASVVPGDELKIYILDKYFESPLNIIYEDKEMLAVDKPAGLPVDVDQTNVGADTLKARVKAYCPEAELCHRLDAGTSGVVLCAKTPEVHARLLKAFAGHQLEKKYELIVCGHVHPEHDLLTAYLKKDAASARVRIYDHPVPGAQEIQTEYKLLKKGWVKDEPVTRLQVTLITGRTHQIRAHMAHMGWPLVGDDKYGNRSVNKLLGGSVCLHASGLMLLGDDLPDRWQGRSFTSPAPKWFDIEFPDSY